MATRARRALEAAVLVIAGVASMATSQAPPAVALQPVQPAQPVQTACARLRVLTCERSPSSSFVVVEATGTDPISCDLAITQAKEIDSEGDAFGVDQLPAPLRVTAGEKKTFGLAFLRHVAPGDESGHLALQLDVARTPADGTATEATAGFDGTCTPR